MRTRHITTAATLLIVMIAVSVKGQEVSHGEVFELNAPLQQNTSHEYWATDHIELGYGFFALPQSPNYTVMGIDPFYNPELQYGDTIWKPSDCYEAGRLGFYPMDFDVNDNGAAVINMPLDFPEGINGMTPHLSLNYNSQGGNGIMGIGWSLGGMSKISRVPYTYIYNDSCGSVNFSNADQLSLDGVTLIKGSKDGKICYYPEIYDYSIVYPINESGNLNDGFRVLKKDGNIYTYAAKYYLQNAIQTPIEWHLSRVEDPFGNYIQYSYKNDYEEGAFYPDSILYTGNGDTEPAYKIMFRYYGEDERVDCPQKWFSKPGDNKVGYSRITKKLTDIECWYDGHRIICYNLTYRNLDWYITALWMVNKQVFNYGGKSDAISRLAPTEFQWTNTDYQLQYETAAEGISLNTNYNSSNLWQQYTAFAARFEQYKVSNDTLEKYENDIVHLMETVDGGSHYFLNVIKSNNIVNEQGQAYHFNDSGNSYNCNSINGIYGAFGDGRIIVGFFPADTNGDGLDEIVCASYYPSRQSVWVTLIKPDVHGVFYETECVTTIGCTNKSQIKNLTIGDFNGDGLSDLFCLYDDDSYSYFKICFSTDGAPFSYPITNSCNHYMDRKVIIADFDGSKKDQIIILGNINNPVGYCYHVFKNQNGVDVMSGPHEILDDIPECFFNHSCRRLCVGDFNGDGKKDILLLCALDWRFYFSKGNGGFGNAIINTKFHNDEYANTNETETTSPAFMLVADLDDDGCDDLSINKVKEMLHGSNRYNHFFRRDFLIRPTGDQNEILIERKRNLRHWWLNGVQYSTDISIDSIFMSGDYYAVFNPFITIMGNHKGISPVEIMSCRMGYISGTYNLGLYLHNTGCLAHPPVRAVNKIITSLGATTEIVYKPVSYQFDRNQEFGRELENRNLTHVLPFYGYMNIVEKVLSETNEEMVDETLNKTYRMTRYHFARPYYHTRGRGFLGFRKVWSRRQGRNLDSNPTHTDDILITKDFALNGTYHVLVPSSLRTDRFTADFHHTPEQCDKTEFEYSFNDNTLFESDLGQIPNGVFAPYLSYTISQHDNGNPIYFEKETCSKDGFGNTTEHQHFYGVSNTELPFYEKKTTVYDNSITTSRWLTGIPKTETTESALSNVPPAIIRHTSYVNDLSSGRHLQKTTEPGDEKQLTEAYTYDGFGNLTSTSLTGNGETRTESVTYSEDGRFPVATTNAIGHTTHYYYNETFGRLDSLTDPNGLTTSYRYDILGDLIQTRYPTGVIEDQYKMWVGNPNNPHSHYHPDTPNFGYPIYFTYTKQSGGRESYTFFDQHNRKLREVSHTMDGMKTYVDYRYHDITGLLQGVSAPYHPDFGETSNGRFSTYTYDYLDRNIRIDRPDGAYMTHTYQTGRETTIDFDGQQTEIQYTLSGLPFTSWRNQNVPASTVYFLCYGDGKLFQTTAGSPSNAGTRIVYTYDVNRNPKTVNDPSLGELTYDYNAFGELTHSTTPSNEAYYTHDALGRMKTRSDTDGQSSWFYDNGFKGVLTSTVYEPTEGPSVRESFTYDRLGHLTRQTQLIYGQPEWAFVYTYNRLGQQNSITYPSGQRFKYHYDSYGFMNWVKDAQTNSILWQANASDRWDNITDFTDGDIQVTYTYDPITGVVNSIAATRDEQTILDQTYHWTARGNLDWRTDATLNLKESFTYDIHNRLKTAVGTPSAGGTPYFSQGFDFAPNGNITAKTGVESYAYGSSTNPYAVTGLQPSVGQEGLFTDQTVTYTSFDKLRTIYQDGKTLTVQYGIDRQRVTQVLETEDAIRTKRYFTPLYETVTEGNVTKKLHYLTAGTGLFAIFASYNTGGSTMHYTLKDHQGSLTATVCGNTVERLSYDAWGRRRNPNGFGYGNVSHTFDRGYTLHEHYDDFDLINMNGRLYDPVLGRMLSPDIAIQDEHNAQAYNRYSYCFNNPLRFTDPSGYVVQMPFEYYGLETFGYGYLGRHSFKGSSFNTEATEGRQIPLDDWFENEETGEVYYNANMHKGDEGSGDMKGNGWKWLGPNGMFTDGDIGAEISLVARRNGIINNDEVSLMLDPIAANRFMLAQGYKQVPKQAIEYSYSYTESYYATPGRNFNITYGENYRYWEKVGYVPKDFVLMATTTIGQTLYGTLHMHPLYMPQVSRNIYSYEEPTLLGRIGRALKTLNGYHDYIFYHDGGSIESYYKSGASNSLINEFLKRYPK